MAGRDEMPRRHTIDTIKARFKAEVGSEYTVLSNEYISYGDKNFSIRHNKCNTVYTTSVCNFFNGSRCKICKQKVNGKNALAALKSKYTIEWAKELVKERGNGEYILLDDTYSNIHTKMQIKHIVCNSIFNPTLNNFRQGTRCPECTDTSRGERHTIDALNQLGFQFEKQKTFPDLKYKRLLKIDFWLEEQNIAIEYDGDQHFRNDGFFHKEENAIRDNLKNEYCKKNNIQLIRIPYHKRTVKAIKEFILSNM